MSGTSPIVVIGANRSGTSAVTRMLDQLGLFVGQRRDQNHEAQFFFHLNCWILDGSGASRAWPAKVADTEGDPDARAAIAEYLRFMVSSPRAVLFMGASRYARLRDIRRLTLPWGWKDPANTFTLPFWQDVFGKVRVLSVVRHPADVISSMRSLARSDLLADVQQFRRYRWISVVRPKHSGFAPFVRCHDLDGAWSWYEEHIRQCQQIVASMGHEAMEVRFEDLASDPTAVLSRMATFCGLEPSPATIRSVCDGFRRDRALAFRQDPDLVEFSRTHEDVFATYGYSSGDVARYAELIHAE
ncbi:MAG: sulfotransferase [Mycobacteriales bacterium]